MTLRLLFLALVQGLTELFPVSSLAHSIIIPALLHLKINRAAPWFLPFIVVLHVGTATALLAYFWRDWWGILKSLIQTRGRTTQPETRLFWLLVLGTVPAGLLGLLLERWVRGLFAGFTVAAVFLVLNGVGLWVGDRLKRREGVRRHLDELRPAEVLCIGLAQATALIPGISRSAATLVTGLATGLDYEAAARFSFLLATPIIGAAGLLEIPKLFLNHTGASSFLGSILLAGLVAGLCAWFSIWFLMRYFRFREVTALRPFAVYCVLMGLSALMLH
ncbi:MAG: undecaprenyl-diphosphate phosphatase [Gammaproteobacteria bacterium]